MATRSVRIDGDIVAAAEATSARTRRSTAEQINYWADIGRRVTSATGVDQRRLDRVVSGDEQFSSLSADERVIAHARIDADIDVRAAATNLAAMARLDGVTTVTIDDDGTLIQTSPDGTITPL